MIKRKHIHDFKYFEVKHVSSIFHGERAFYLLMKLSSTVNQMRNKGERENEPGPNTEDEKHGIAKFNWDVFYHVEIFIIIDKL